MRWCGRKATLQEVPRRERSAAGVRPHTLRDLGGFLLGGYIGPSTPHPIHWGAGGLRGQGPGTRDQGSGIRDQGPGTMDASGLESSGSPWVTFDSSGVGYFRPAHYSQRVPPCSSCYSPACPPSHLCSSCLSPTGGRGEQEGEQAGKPRIGASFHIPPPVKEKLSRK